MLVPRFYPELGGVQRLAHNLAKYMAQQDIPVSVLARKCSGSPSFEQMDGFEVHRMPLIAESVYTVSTISYLSMSLLWLVKYQSKYNILHCHGLFSDTMLGILAKKLTKNKKVVVTVHTSDKFSEVEALKRKPFANKRINSLSEVDGFVAINPAIQNELTSIGIEQERITYIPNGVSIPIDSSYDISVKKKYRNLLGLDYKKIALFVGRLSAEKNLDVLLHAWKQIQIDVPDAHLLILGSGGKFRNVETEIRQLAKDLQLNETVHFMGYIDDVTTYLLAGDIFVLLSSTEGMSVALLEAMSAGLGIVASNVPGNANLITDEKTGLLVKPGDVNGTVIALNKLLKNPALTADLGKAARQKAILEYSIDSVASLYIDLYRRVLFDEG